MKARRCARRHRTMWAGPTEPGRGALVAAAIAGVAGLDGIEGPIDGLLLGLMLWGIPVALLAGSAFHEGTSVRSASPHAVDWLLKRAALLAASSARSREHHFR